MYGQKVLYEYPQLPDTHLPWFWSYFYTPGGITKLNKEFDETQAICRKILDPPRLISVTSILDAIGNNTVFGVYMDDNSHKYIIRYEWSKSSSIGSVSKEITNKTILESVAIDFLFPFYRQMGHIWSLDSIKIESYGWYGWSDRLYEFFPKNKTLVISH